VKANVYVPPASLASETAAPVKADVYVPPASLAPAAQPKHAAAATASSSGFEWSSAGEGAAAGIAAVLLAFGAALGLRRRRQAGPAIGA
jgi:MYXO-CTERM domain-containing protein